MKQFEYLSREHTKALSLFDKVARRLRNLQAEIGELIHHATDNIRESERQIEAQRDSIAYLTKQLDGTSKSLDQVQQFLPKSEEPKGGGCC